MTPERAPSEPGHGISWLSSTSASVKSLWLNSKCGSTRSITPTVSIGSGSEPAGRMRSVAARTADCRCAKVGLRASASATSDCRIESPATGAERSEEHTSELQSPCNLVCRLLLEKKKRKYVNRYYDS